VLREAYPPGNVTEGFHGRPRWGDISHYNGSSMDTGGMDSGEFHPVKKLILSLAKSKMTELLILSVAKSKRAELQVVYSRSTLLDSDVRVT